jgi:sulfur-oxidizing protein SoxY
MTKTRRLFLKGTLATGVVGVAVGAGLLTPSMVLAAWPKEAFEAKEVDGALQAFVGTSETQSSDAITIRAPDIAENGAVVPITVSAEGLSSVESISILVPENASPLAAAFTLAGNADPFASTRIKMGRTSDVIAVVKANGQVYSTRKEVKVTIGGCGG